MKVSELITALDFSIISEGDTSIEWDGVYVGDLLSRAMSHVRFDNLWITIMTNTNVIAVASLTEAAAVILAEGVELLPDALEAARENGISVLSTNLTVYELCTKLAAL